MLRPSAPCSCRRRRTSAGIVILTAAAGAGWIGIRRVGCFDERSGAGGGRHRRRTAVGQGLRWRFGRGIVRRGHRFQRGDLLGVRGPGADRPGHHDDDLDDDDRGHGLGCDDRWCVGRFWCIRCFWLGWRIRRGGVIRSSGSRGRSRWHAGLRPGSSPDWRRSARW